MKTYKFTENNITYDIYEYVNGNKYWFLNGKLHRENGPAVEHSDGSKKWYKNDMCHRDDGPAIEWINGKKEYWYYGKYLDIDSYKELTRYVKLFSIY